MGFGINNKQITILESRFEFYENLSKETLHKLEKAINKITESNHTVSIILERHENRLDNVAQTNTLIIKMIDEIQTLVNKKISLLEKKIEDVSKMKLMIVGVGMASAILATSISTLASGWWRPSELGIQHQYVPSESSKSK